MSILLSRTLQFSKLKLALILIPSFLALTLPAIAAEEVHPTGLKEMTRREFRKLNRTRIVRVKPNHRSLDRKRSELRARRAEFSTNLEAVNVATIPEDEIQAEVAPTSLEEPASSTEVMPLSESLSAESLSATSTVSAGTEESVAAIPAAVDNSLLPAFPPIANQGSEGSCAAFAATYYQFSHETCLARGCNNKTGTQTRFSPRWTYNMVNDGVDAGSWFSDHFDVLSFNGAVNLTQLPYNAGDFKTWDLSSDHWRSAISYRANVVQSISAIHTATGLDTLKQYLANGHVVNYATYVNSWHPGRVGTDPTPGASSPHTGEYAVLYMDNLRNGGHAMTIVGYDDNVWIDINGDGRVDTGEKGAFKVANSWGTSWGTSGFGWIPYDAIQATSTVPSPPGGTARSGIFWYNTVYTITARSSYSPKLLAQFTVNTPNRSLMSLSIGSSTTTSSFPTTTKLSGALSLDGGPFSFNGTSTPIDGTFYLDLTDLIAATHTGMKYYLSARDLLASTGTDPSLIVKDLRILDPQTSTVTLYSGTLPQTINNTTAHLAISLSTSITLTPPRAVIAATEHGGISANAFTFDGTGSSDTDGAILSYTWNFGDGSPTTTGASVNHTYTTPGFYSVSLTVLDDNNLSNRTNYLAVYSKSTTLSAPTSLKAVFK